jgi:hypothetical protein
MNRAKVATGPGATSAAQAEMWGLTYAFFAQKLGLGGDY